MFDDALQFLRKAAISLSNEKIGNKFGILFVKEPIAEKKEDWRVHQELQMIIRPIDTYLQLFE